MRTLAPAALLILALAGCSPAAPASAPSSAPEADTVSAPCAASLEALQAVDAADFEAEDAAILVSLDACESVAEYTAAVTDNPESWLMTEEQTADADRMALVFASACGIDGADTTAVCVDAAAQGILD